MTEFEHTTSERRIERTPPSESPEYRDEYPIDENGEPDYTAMLTEMGFKLTNHPVRGNPHRINGDVVTVFGVQLGELQLEDNVYGPYEKSVTDLYDQWLEGNLTVERVSMRDVASDEIVVEKDAVSTLISQIRESSPVPDPETEDALRASVEAFNNDADAGGTPKMYGLFTEDPDADRSMYTMIGDPVGLNPSTMSRQEVHEAVCEIVTAKHNFDFEISTEDTFIAEIRDFQ